MTTTKSKRALTINRKIELNQIELETSFRIYQSIVFCFIDRKRTQINTVTLKECATRLFHLAKMKLDYEG